MMLHPESDPAEPNPIGASEIAPANQGVAGPALRDWSDLSSDEQTTLLIDYGSYLDQLPPTCDLRTKVERFRAWLEGRGIRYRD